MTSHVLVRYTGARAVPLSLIALAMLTIPASAQWFTWRTAGPPGGIVHGIAACDSTVAIATARGVGVVRLPFLRPLLRLSGPTTGVAVVGPMVLASTDSGRILRARTVSTYPFDTLRIADELGTARIIAQSGQRVYVTATASSGDPVRVYRTDDTGSTWTVVYSAPSGWPVTTIAIDGGRVVLGSLRGAVESRDSGRTWTRISEEMHPFVGMLGDWTIAATPTRVARTRDLGQTWDSLPLPIQPGVEIRSLVVHAGSIVLGTTAGVAVSRDSGLTWTWSRDGLTNSTVTALLSSGDSLLAGTNGGGLHTSRDGGTTWAVMPHYFTAAIHDVCVVDLRLPRPWEESTTYAATSGGVYRRGMWEDMWEYSGLHDQILSVAGSDRVVLAGSADSGLFRSTDGGTSWRRVDEGIGDSASAIVTLWADGPLALAQTNVGMYRSLDTGRTWSAASVDEIVIFRALRQGAFERSGDVLLFGGGGYFLNDDYGVLLRSSDDGATWTRTPDNFAPIAALLAGDGTLWAGVNGFYTRGLRRSTDGGFTWAEIPDTSAVQPGVTSLAFAPPPIRYPELIVGTTNWVSMVDTAAPYRWFRWWRGPAEQGPGVTALVAGATEQTGSYVLAGTTDYGVWEYWVVIDAVRQPVTRRLELHPNPARGIVRADVTGLDGELAVTVSDALGRTAHSAQTRADADGTVAVDLRGLNPGMYLLTISDGHGVRTATVVLLR